MSKQRYEQEIEEILRKYDEQTGRKDRPTGKPPVELSPPPPQDRRYHAPRQAPPKSGFSMPNWKRISSGAYLLLAFAVALLAVLLKDVFPTVTFVLIVVSAALFLVPIFLYRSTGTTTGGYTPSEQKRWRGQVIDFNSSNDPLESIKRWFKRK